jgi:acetyl-CoA carboxylase biotin carboxyl carrier protein
MGWLDVDSELVKKLAKLLEETGLTEIEYRAFGRSLRVSRQRGGHGGEIVVAAPAAAPVPAAALPPATAFGPAHPGAVTAPVVGTVYVAPEPGARPFVSAGDTVKKGQTLLIIEAMKTMNPVAAPRAGKVAQILVEDGAPVEYGEVLLILE